MRRLGDEVMRRLGDEVIGRLGDGFIANNDPNDDWDTE